MVKKLLSLTLCAALTVSGFPARAFADDPPAQTGTQTEQPPENPQYSTIAVANAQRLFEHAKLFSGDNDPLRSHLFHNGKLTLMGEQYFHRLERGLSEGQRDAAREEADRVRAAAEQAGKPITLPADADPRVVIMHGSLQQIRELGTATPEMIQGATDRINEARRNGFVGGIDQQPEEIRALAQGLAHLQRTLEQGRGGDPSQFSVSQLLQAGFQGMREAAPPRDQQNSGQFVQVNTDNGYVMMDSDGVAVKQTKKMICQNRNWGQGAEPMVLSMRNYRELKADREGAGTWGQWICQESVGETIFNRDILKMQQQMNQNAPDCAPRIDETGRYHPAMIAYGVCRQRNDVEMLEQAYGKDRLNMLAAETEQQLKPEQIEQNGGLNSTTLQRVEELARSKKIEGGPRVDGACRDNIEQYRANFGVETANARLAEMGLLHEGKGTGYVENYLQLVNCKLLVRRITLDKAKDALDRYAKFAGDFEGRNLLTDADMQAAINVERLVTKWTTANLVATRRQGLVQQLGALSFDFNAAKGADRQGTRNTDLIPYRLKWGWPPFESTKTETPESQQIYDAMEKAGWEDWQIRAYRAQGERMAQRMARTVAAYDLLFTQIVKTSHVGDSMSAFQPLLQAAEKDAIELQQNFRIYASIPVWAKEIYDKIGSEDIMGFGRNSWFGNLTHQAARWLMPKLEGVELWGIGKAARAFNESAEYLEKLKGQLPRMEAAVMGGDYDQVRRLFLAVDPAGMLTGFQRGFGKAADMPTSADAIEAAFRRTQTAFEKYTQVYTVVDTAVNLIKTSIVLGVLGPAAAPLLKGFGAGAEWVGGGVMGWMPRLAKGFKDASTLGKVGRVAGMAGTGVLYVPAFILRGGGVLLTHLGHRLSTLAPVRENVRGFTIVDRFLYSSTLSSINAGMRMGGFMVLAGGIGAGISAITHQVKVATGGQSPFKSAGDAAWQAGVQGAHWATDSWHPLILFAGFSSRVFEGVPGVQHIANSLANRGVIGNAVAAVRGTGSLAARFGRFVGRAPPLQRAAGTNFFKTWVRPIGTGTARGAGAAGKFVMEKTFVGTVARNPLVQIADHIAKYHLASEGAGWVAKQVVYAQNLDGDDLSRQAARARAAKMAAMESPVWLLIPVGDAKGELMAAEHQRAAQAVDDYIATGQASKVANWVEGSPRLAELRPPRVSALERLFSARIGGPKQTLSTFEPTPDLIAKARRHLVNEALRAEGGHPLVLLRIYENKLDPGFRVDKPARDMLMEMFGEALATKNVDIALQFLSAKSGARVGGYAARLRTRQRMALELLMRDAQGKRVPQHLLDAARKATSRMQMMADAELALAKAAEEYVAAKSKVGKASEKETQFFENYLQELRRWADDFNAKEGVDDAMRLAEYKRLFDDLEKQARTALGEGPMLNALLKARDMMAAHGKFLQGANNTQSAVRIGGESVQAVAREMEQFAVKHPELERAVRETSDDISRFSRENGDAAGIAELWQAQVVKPMNARLQKIIDNPQTAANVKEMAEIMRDEVGGAPALVRDQNGTNLLVPRPGQLRTGLDVMLTTLSGGDVSAALIRHFALAETGLGKTFLGATIFRPIAEAASAAGKGKTPIFLTVNNKLLAQAREDFRAYGLTRSRMQFDTYEGFKSRLAQGDKATNYFVLADEMDGAALQAALTLGEGAGKVTFHSTEYEMLSGYGNKSLALLDGGLSNLQGNLRRQISSLRRSADNLPGGALRDRLLDLAKKLEGESSKLMGLHGRHYDIVLDRGVLLQRARGGLRNLVREGLNPARDGTPRGPLAEQARGAAARWQAQARTHRQRGRIQAAEAAEAKARRITDLSAAVERLESAQSPAALRRMASRRNALADRLDDEFSGMHSKLAEAKSLRESAAETLRLDGPNARGLAKDMHARANALERGVEKQLVEMGAETMPAKIPAGERANLLVQRIETLQREPGLAARLKTEAKTFETRATTANPEAMGEASKQVNDQLRALWQEGQAARVQRTKNSMLQLLAEQEALAGRFGAQEASSLRAQIGELKETVNWSRGHTRADRRAVAQQINSMLTQEAHVLRQSATNNAAQVRELRWRAAGKLLSGKAGEASSLWSRARELAQESRYARAQMKAIRGQIRRVLNGGGANWEGELRELLAHREKHLKQAVRERNPVWDTWKEMDDFMRQHAHSQKAVLEDWRRIDGAPADGAKKLEFNIRRMRRLARAEIRRLEALKRSGNAGTGIDTRIQQMREMHRQVRRRSKAMLEEMHQLQRGEISKPKDAKHETLLKKQAEQEFLVRELTKEKLALEQQRSVAAVEAKASFNERIAEIDKKLRGEKRPDGTRTQGAEDILYSIEKQLVPYRKYYRADVEARFQRLQRAAHEFADEMQAQYGGNPDAAGMLRHLRSQAEGWGNRIEVLNAKPEVEIKRLYRRAAWQSVKYSWRLMRQLVQDKWLPRQQRWDLFWDIAPGGFLPRNPLTGKTSYVLTEMYNLASGHLDNPRQFRYDGITKKIIPVHNGEPSPTMDVPTKRHWEVKYKTDLTLKYGEGKIETYRSITENLKTEFIGFSGTQGQALKRFHDAHNIKTSGNRPADAGDMPIVTTRGFEGRFQRIAGDLRIGMLHDMKQVLAGKQADALLLVATSDTRNIKFTLNRLRRTNFEFTDAQLRAEGIANPSSTRIQQLRQFGYEVRRGRIYQRDAQGRRVQGAAPEDGWIITLRRGGRGGEGGAVTKIFSGSELLRETRTQANVPGQENTAAMKSGEVKLVLIDARVGGRGVDLPFKGNTKGGGTFQGYNRYKMQIHEPNLLSGPLKTQIEGRIGYGRIGQGKFRRFEMVLDLKTSFKDVEFQTMLRDEPVMRWLRDHGRQRGLRMRTWDDIYSLVHRLEGDPFFAPEVRRYHETVKRYLEKQQYEVEQGELRSSQVLRDSGQPDFMRMHLLPLPSPYRGLRGR